MMVVLCYHSNVVVTAVKFLDSNNICVKNVAVQWSSLPSLIIPRVHMEHLNITIHK